MLWRYGPDDRPAFFNRPTLDFLGLGEREALRADIYALMHPEDRERLVAADRSYWLNPAVFRERYRQRRAGQEYRWILEHCRPGYDSHDNLVGHFGSTRDITDSIEGN